MDISILFATRNRAAQLRQTLDCYRNLDTSGIDWELVIVDNGSSDDTAEVLEQASRDLPLRRLYHSPAGQNRARNQALDSLQGELLIFTDDDALPDTHCLQAYLQASQRWPDQAIFGARILPEFPSEAPDWLTRQDSAFARTAFGLYQPRMDEGHVTAHPYGPSFAIRRVAFAGHRFCEQLGPQAGDYATGGEAKLLREMRAQGHAFVFVPSAIVRHVVRPEQLSVDWLLSRARKRGRGQAHMPTRRRRGGLRVGGVPLKLVTATIRSWIRFRVGGKFLTTMKRAELGFAYELRHGELLELRKLARQ